ncbi:MAG: CatA-like O-acetyltransferase [Candidatus Omnitrophica bacterium]|nr:CatA-like O-acetyltransferase [Candidatus Omnitrophota bacterium]
MMEYIDFEKWPRKTHFEYFEQAAYPYIDLTVQMEVTAFIPYVKERGHKFFPALLYCFVKGFNAIEEFRYRILEKGVVKYDRIHVNTTVPIEGERFAFCRVEYKENVHEFFKEVAAAEGEAKKQSVLVSNDCFDVAWVSCNPWFSFTSMSAPTVDRKMRSIPVILVGKYFESGGKTLLPLSMKVNHALIDGIHIGKLLTHFENSFSNPGKIFG